MVKDVETKLTPVFQKSANGYIKYVEELPRVNTQRETLDESRKNLIEAIRLVLEAYKELCKRKLKAKNLQEKEIGEVAI